jgi:hypothetical protein
VGAKIANCFFVLKVAALSAMVVMGTIYSLLGKAEGAGKSPEGWFRSNPSTTPPSVMV